MLPQDSQASLPASSLGLSENSTPCCPSLNILESQRTGEAMVMVLRRERAGQVRQASSVYISEPHRTGTQPSQNQYPHLAPAHPVEWLHKLARVIVGEHRTVTRI